MSVLLVDDDADLRASTAEWLREEGYVVRTANNGVEAMALVGRLRPSVMLLDLDMPVMDGREFLEWWRCQGELPSETPVIVMSGHAPHEEEPAVTQAVKGWLQKPVDVDVLVGEIQRLSPSSRADT